MNMEKTMEKTFDVVGFVMGYEDGQLSKEEVIEGFQFLINTGVVWSLQGAYSGMAKHLIKEGHCVQVVA